MTAQSRTKAQGKVVAAAEVAKADTAESCDLDEKLRRFGWSDTRINKLGLAEKRKMIRVLEIDGAC
jgi:hypothetical protein